MSTWIKLHDNFWEHPKVLAAGEDAALLYVQGLSYCSRNLTDGAIPTAALRNLTARKEARTLARILVREGLWTETATGWSVHDYLKVQRSREQVENERERAKERQRKARVTAMSRRESQRSSDEVTPYVTDPDTESRAAEGARVTDDVEPPDKDAPRRQQRIMEAARMLAEERAETKDVGEGWIVNATKGIAADHHDKLHAHLVANPTASTSELVEVMEPTALAAPSPPAGAVSTDQGVFLPGSGWCQRAGSSSALTNGVAK